MLDALYRDAKTASPTILLIDDDPIALEELGEILELAELRALSAANTEEALILLNARPDIGVVVTDVHIREEDGRQKNGVDFVAEARRRFSDRDIRFIVISGDAAAASSTIGVGVTDFLTKPLLADDLLAAIGEASTTKAPKERESDANAFLTRMFSQKVETLQRVQSDLTATEKAAAAAQREARRLRETDVESGLINAVQLAREIDAAESNRGALLRFDLGGLSEVRDALEPFVAIALILDYAQRLQDMVGRGDLVARLGPQELGLYLSGAENCEDLTAIAARAIRRITRSRVAEDLKVMIRPTVGIALREGEEGESLIAESALALRRALADRPGAVSFFSASLREEADRDLALAAKLREAIERRHISPWFQPQIDLATGDIIGWEALARWRDPVEGMRSPGEFLPIAEKTGLMPELDFTIQNQALTAMRELERLGLAGRRMSLNVTAAQLKDPFFLDGLKIELERVGFGLERITIEILESTLLDHEDAGPIKAAIEKLSALGAAIALDDFGTGHAGLSGLRDLPVDRIKIDRSFIDGVDQRRKLQPFVRALIGLGQALDVEVLAEGVERREELDWLRREGCDAMQGFHLGQPMPLDDIPDWAARRRAG